MLLYHNAFEFMNLIGRKVLIDSVTAALTVVALQGLY